MPATTVIHVSQAVIILLSNQRMGRYSLLLLLELGVTAIEWVRCRRRNRRRKARKMWVRPYITKREGQGAYANLLAELRGHEKDSYKNFLRMPPYVFDWLLGLVAPLIQKQDTKYRASISSYPPTNDERCAVRKRREEAEGGVPSIRRESWPSQSVVLTK